MFFLLPLVPLATTATVTIGEALGIGASVFGIGAGIKGAIDYHEAKTLQESAHAKFRTMAARIRRKAKAVQKRLEAFGKLKLETYTGIIQEAVDALSHFKIIDLSSFKDIQVERVSFIKQELDLLEKSSIKASDVLSCLSVGINTAVHDRIPYKDTPPLFRSLGAFINPKTSFILPNIPYAAITMAGLSWGISGDAAKTCAKMTAADIAHETEKMRPVLTECKALINRITEGRTLITTVTGKLRTVLKPLQETPPVSGETLSDSLAENIETAISLTKALKQVIEVDIVNGNGLLTKESGVVFQKIAKEHLNYV
jgi:hypothetical protein